MSLINDMLKDLETRGGGPAAGGAIRPVANRAEPAVGRSRLVVVLSGFVVILIAALGYVTWNTKPVQTTNAVTIPAAAAAPVLQDEGIENEMPASPVMAENEKSADDEPVAVSEMTAVPVALAAVPDEDRGSRDENDARVTRSAPEAETPPAERSPAAPEPETRTAAASADEGTVIVRRHEPTPEQRAQRAGRDGLAALRRGDWALAARLLQELIEVEPANDDGREGLAVALQRQGRLAEADGVLLDGIAMAAAPARFAKLRARTLVARGELENALNSLSIAIPPIKEDPEYHALRGAIAQQAGRSDIAIETYSNLTRFEPANGTWQAGLAMALDRSGKLQEARETYQRALDAGGLEPALLAHVQRRLAALKQHQAE